ncbi:T9SS type A sorting domain-containing protein, partial [Ancylomarina sp. 16SWW S1-10-2]|uniref:T9SS type A sorting domain-containing protein n=1 Tax=Ancylomarina sp. 16SWW S1-10-2 TaxID=2499681 RepID=UPI0012AE6491
SSVFASGNLTINKYRNTDYSIVSVFNTSNSNLKLKVYDYTGHVFYSETIKAETNTQKLFDLSNLSDGDYSLVLVGDNTRIEESFIVKSKKLDVSNETMQIAENKN